MGCASSHEAHVILVVNKGWIKKPHVSEGKKVVKNPTADRTQSKITCSDGTSLGRVTRFGTTNSAKDLVSAQSFSRTSSQSRHSSMFLDIKANVPPHQRCLSSKMCIYKSLSLREPSAATSNTGQNSKDNNPVSPNKAVSIDDSVSTQEDDELNHLLNKEWNFNGSQFTDPIYNSVIAITVHKTFFNDFGDNFDDLDFS